MRYSASSLLLGTFLLANCGHQQPHRTAGSVAASTQPSPSVASVRASTRSDTPSTTAVDSLLVDVTQPTVVAYFATTQAQIDSEPDLDEALGDFQTYLPRARDSLEKLGVALREQYRDTIVYREGTAIKRWRPPPDSAEVGYVLLVRGAPPRATYGVDTDIDLVDWVEGMLKEMVRPDTTPPTRPAP